MNAETRIDWESWEVDEPSASFADALMDVVATSAGSSAVVGISSRRRNLRSARFLGAVAVAVAAAAVAVGSLTVLAMIGHGVRGVAPVPAASSPMTSQDGRSAAANADLAAHEGLAAKGGSLGGPWPRPPQHAAGTAIDRQQRDEMRSRIVPASARRDVERDPHTGLVVPSGSSGPSHNLSREYLEQRIREDFHPMGLACYESALARKPELRGRIIVNFMIVGDAKVGGIVDQVEINEHSDIDDTELKTCIRESMLSMVFAPPDNNGWVSVTYPFVFSPNDDDTVHGSGENHR